MINPTSNLIMSRHDYVETHRELLVQLSRFIRGKNKERYSVRTRYRIHGTEMKTEEIP
jgi:hypothetical protein